MEEVRPTMKKKQGKSSDIQPNKLNASPSL